MLPGAISYKLCLIWTGKRSKYSYGSLIDIFILSVVSYLAFDGIRFICSLFFKQITVTEFTLSLLLSETSPINYWTIIATTTIGVGIAIICSLVNKHNILARIGQFFKFSDTISPDTVWVDFMKTNDKWIFVVDHKLNQTYYGRSAQYSDAAEPGLRELYMKDVTVYPESGDSFELSSLFLSRNADELTIQIKQSSEKENSEKIKRKKGFLCRMMKNNNQSNH